MSDRPGKARGEAREAARPPVYRAPMRSRDDAVDAAAAVERALATGICGIGGRQAPLPATLEAALRQEDAQRGERAARRLERFAAAPLGATVWTRDVDGHYWRGRLAGAWRYDRSAEAAEVDLVHVRACDWEANAVPMSEVPLAVRAAFDRGGRNWQRIRAL